MRHYGHLTLCEREDIMLMRREGRKITEIAEAIGRSKSTVSRELRRNSCQRFYRASTAQGRYESRRKACRRPRILDNDDLFRLVGDKFLGEQWSPEQIEGRLALELGASPVSDSTIYRAIAEGRFDACIGGRRAACRLRRKGRRRRSPQSERRGKITGARDIGERPAEAESRARLGDWEADTVAGVAGGACLVTLVDRKSGYLVGGKCARKASDLCLATVFSTFWLPGSDNLAKEPPMSQISAFPSIKALSILLLVPLNSTSLPWWTTLSIIAEASLSSPRIVPHLLNSMLVVNTTLRFS